MAKSRAKPRQPTSRRYPEERIDDQAEDLADGVDVDAAATAENEPDAELEQLAETEQEPKPRPALPELPYYKPFKGAKEFFVGIRPERRRVRLREKERVRTVYPCEGVAVTGLQFSRKTARVVEEEAYDDHVDAEAPYFVLSLSTPEAGEKVRLTWERIEHFLKRVRSRYVRWNHRNPILRIRASLVDYFAKRYEYDTQKPGCPGTPVGWAVTPAPDKDEPLAASLVLLHWKELERFGGRAGILQLPTVGELAPETTKYKRPRNPNA